MPAKTKRQEISDELAKLRSQHYEALAKATFAAFSATEETAYQERIKLMVSLVNQLAALQEFPK